VKTIESDAVLTLIGKPAVLDYVQREVDTDDVFDIIGETLLQGWARDHMTVASYLGDGQEGDANVGPVADWLWSDGVRKHELLRVLKDVPNTALLDVFEYRGLSDNAVKAATWTNDDAFAAECKRRGVVALTPTALAQAKEDAWKLGRENGQEALRKAARDVFGL
jgi:hypothetical protein